MTIKRMITPLKYPVMAILFAFAMFSVTQAATRPAEPVDEGKTVELVTLSTATEGLPHTSPSVLADSPISPTQPVKLIFIHHSCGGNWLADISEHEQAGGLGQALMENNYFVSATNYGWGPGSIGSGTNVPDWPNWFTGPSSSAVLDALYSESGQNICGDDMCFGNWSRLATDPGGENEIVMFKSCYPNSDVYGNPGDPPASEPNADFTVSNFKAVYNNLLTYFETRQDKLFIVITAPPMAEASYLDNDPSTPAANRAANARAFNNWLVRDWLATNGYTHTNVAVFDFYNVLTSNGSASRVDDTSTREEPNDYDLRPDGNHHYWNGSGIVHTQTISSDFAAYPYFSVEPISPDLWCDNHPTSAGNQKATAEFVPLLNVFYNRWKSGAPLVPPELELTAPSASTQWPVSSTRQIDWTTTGVVTRVNLFYSADSFVTSQTITLSLSNTNSYAWTTPPVTTTSAQIRVESVISPTTVYDVSEPFRLYQPGVMDQFVYLPLILRNYTPTPVCAAPLTGVTISGPTSGYTDTVYSFTANPTPAGATTPISYTWSPEPSSGQGTVSASYQWVTTGSKTINLAASNCDGAHSADDAHIIDIQAQSSSNLVQPSDLVYLGAFRLPDMAPGTPATMTWEYSGQALTYRPDGDPGGEGDGYPGSLFGTGHDLVNYASELSIPAPITSSNVADLNYATTIQGFADVRGGLFDGLEEMPRVGMQYLPAQTGQTSSKLYLSWGAHHHDEGSPSHTPSHAWCDTTLSAPNTQGAWWVGDDSIDRLYRSNGYIFEIPETWANTYLGGARLATGRYRDGGWSGMGPNIFAYGPWLDGSPPVSGTILTARTVLSYSFSGGEYALDNYQDSDEWEGGAWLQAGNRAAVVFVGTKGGGSWWYGYSSPAGDGAPCPHIPDPPDVVRCYNPDGTDCDPVPDCVGYVVESKGWWSSRFDAQIIFYDPADFVAVMNGTTEPYEPQPYATLDIDEYLFLDWPTETEVDCGASDQRKCRIGEVAYDRDSGFLYVLERFADEAKPVVHVWRVD